nr:ribonuclease H-like domain-containing protein [Tanacetum cinerariifolium]
MRVIDKTGLGYDGHVNESEVLNNVVDSCESDRDDNQVNDRFKKGEGYHAVLPPYTGNYMPQRADLSFDRLDNSVFKFKELDSKDENVFKPKEVKKTVKRRLEKIEFVNARNTTVKNENKAEKPRKFSKSPRAAVLTKSEQVPVNAAKQSSQRAAALVSVARHVNTAASRPNLNSALPTTYSYFKAHSPVRRGNANGGKITEKGKIRTGKLDFEDVYFVKELKFNLFSVSQMCDKKISVLFTDSECVVLSHDFKLLDESQVLLKTTLDKSNLWHKRLGHINFKTMNKLVRGNLTRGLPLKIFENDHTCVACQKGKQHKSSCIENQMDHKVKTIRCDNRTEFKNKIINEFCEMKGIRRELIIARNSKQNGVAERKNRTLIEATRTMLVDSKLPTTFWAEVVNIACYVQNRVLVIKSHNKTPYELFLGRKHALSFMRPFGCLVTILNTLDHLDKFDGKSDNGFFVGYSINSKAFKVFNTRAKIIEDNMHINFLENKLNVAGIRPNWMFDIDTLTMFMNYQLVFARNQTNGNVGTKANIDTRQAVKKIVHGPQYVLLPLLTSNSQDLKTSEDEIADDARKKSTKVPRKENGVQDLAKECDKNDQEKYVRDQEESLRKQFEQESERLFGQGEAANTNITNRLNTVSSQVNDVSSSLTTTDPGRERERRNEFESMFGQDKDANGNMMFTPISAARSTYVNLGRSIPVNAATLPNADLPTDPLMPNLEDTIDL